MRHVISCKIILSKLNSLEQPFNMTEINQKTHHSMLAEAIVAHDIPYNFVEYDKIRVWMNYLNPYAEMVCRNTEVSNIKNIYNREIIKLKEIMGMILNRICLTSYLWTTLTSKRYICLIAHFVDEN